VTVRERCHACGRPEVIKSANGWLAIFWATHIPLAVWAFFALPRETFIALSLLYTVIASQWANVASHVAGWVAGRVEVEQHDQHES
jgi:hypothetical protein